MTARQTRIIAVLCALFVFAATATALNSWDEIAAILGDGLSVWITPIGEAVR